MDNLIGTHRVPTAAETAASVADAQRALAEIHARRAAEAAHAAEQDRAAQLARWHTTDQQAAADRDTAALEPAADLP